MPERMTWEQVGNAIEDGQILPGDCVLYRFAAPGFVQRMIARVQARAIEDLIGQSWPDMFDNANQYTHAGMVYCTQSSVEMTSPRARRISWERRMHGVAEMVITRPVTYGNLTPAGLAHRLYRAAGHAAQDVNQGTRYPYREIVLYWLWSWNLRKLRNGKGFEEVFRDHRRNVCSGSVIHWWKLAAVPMDLTGTDAWPEAWYPARFLVDSRFETIVRITPTLTEDERLLAQLQYEADHRRRRPVDAYEFMTPTPARSFDRPHCNVQTDSSLSFLPDAQCGLSSGLTGVPGATLQRSAPGVSPGSLPPPDSSGPVRSVVRRPTLAELIGSCAIGSTRGTQGDSRTLLREVYA